MSWTESVSVSSIKLSLIRRVIESAPAGAIDLALGELGYHMPQSLKDKAIELLINGNPCYTPNAGLMELREVIAEHHACIASQVCVCNGAEEAIYISMMAIVNPGDVVAIPDPDYTAYPALCNMLGVEVKRLPLLDGFKEIDWEKWEAILTGGVKAVLLSTPSNPSGFTLTEADALRFGKLCNIHDIIVIVDEIYANLYFANMPITLNGYLNKLIRIGGLSKSHCLSGWRIGWILAPDEIIGAMIKARQYISTCSNWLSQKLACYAITDYATADNIRTQLLQSRVYFLGQMEHSLPACFTAIHIPSATPYIMIQTAHPDEMEVATQLASAGLITVPGRAFGETTKGWLRLNIAVPVPLLEQAVKILRSFS